MLLHHTHTFIFTQIRITNNACAKGLSVIRYAYKSVFFSNVFAGNHRLCIVQSVMNWEKWPTMFVCLLKQKKINQHKTLSNTVSTDAMLPCCHVYIFLINVHWFAKLCVDFNVYSEYIVQKTYVVIFIEVMMILNHFQLEQFEITIQ